MSATWVSVLVKTSTTSDGIVCHEQARSQKLMLKVNNIQVVYNNVIMVLKGISLEVPDGESVALLGANAAGKTTTLKAISGILRFQNGEVEEGRHRGVAGGQEHFR